MGRSGRVGGPSGRSGTGRGSLGYVRNGCGDHWGGPEGVGELSVRYGTGRETLEEVRNWSRTLGEVRNGSEDSRVYTGWVPRPIPYIPSGRSGTGQGTLGEVRDVLGDPQGGSGRNG